MPSATAPSARKPRSTRCACRMLRVSRPAATSRTSVTAVCTTTRPSRIVQRRPALATVASPFMSAARFTRVARSAGASPARSPAPVATSVVKKTTRASMCRFERDRHRDRQRQRRDQLHRECSERDAGERAEGGEHEAFGEELLDQAPPAGADGQPDPDLTLASRRAREEHVGDVCARHQQHQANRDHQTSRHRAEHAVGHGVNANVGRRGDRALLVRLRIRPGQLRHQHLQVRFGSRRGFAVFEAPLHEQPSLAAPIEPGRSGWRGHDVLDAGGFDVLHPGNRRPQLGLQHRHQPGETFRCDADDGVRLSVDQQRAPKRRGIAAEVTDPRRMGDHGDPGRAWPVILRQQRAPDRGRDSEDLEVIAGHDFAERHPGSVPGLQGSDRRAVPQHVGEDGIARLEIEVVEIRVRGESVPVAATRVDVHDPGRIGNRQRPEQERVDDREERRVEPDAHGQREHRDRGKPRTAEQPLQCVAYVCQHAVRYACGYGAVQKKREPGVGQGKRDACRAGEG